MSGPGARRLAARIALPGGPRPATRGREPRAVTGVRNRGAPAGAGGALRTALALAATALAACALAPSAALAAPSNAERSWYFISRGTHARPAVPVGAASLVRRYDGLWIGPRKHKVLYLTFDAATEFGTTARIVRILDRTNVQASFFLTGQYMRDNPEMTRRLATHGHLVCNHSFSHPNMVRLAGSRKAFARQLSATDRACRAATGNNPAPFFRFPAGVYSARSLSLAREFGYTTVFWSFAHVDWDEHNQPPVSVTRARLLAAAAPGVVYLLHAGSKSDTDALGRVVEELQRRGFSFGTLSDLVAPEALSPSTPRP
jgi:peptidoglycan-N-acetylmuramic acid deacetylase